MLQIPRWDLAKFFGVNRRIGSAMKSVGEVQAIGRNFEEAFQKALRMLDLGYKGFEPGLQPANDFDLKNPTDVRPLVLATALQQGYTVDRLFELTKIDRWFLHKCRRIIEMNEQLKKFTMTTLPRELLLHAKKLGYTDSQVGSRVSNRSQSDLFLPDRQGHLPQRAWRPLLAQVLRPCSVCQAD